MTDYGTGSPALAGVLAGVQPGDVAQDATVRELHNTACSWLTFGEQLRGPDKQKQCSIAPRGFLWLTYFKSWPA